MTDTTIGQTTGTPYLLRELTELGNLVFGMFAGPDVTVRHWPVYYRVYVEIDGLCREVSRVAGHLARGFIGADGTVDAERTANANACFARVDGHVRAIAAMLADTVHDRLVIPGNPALLQIADRHFAPESQYYRALQAHYRSGCIAPDGGTLVRIVLSIDPHPARWCRDGVPVDRQRFGLAPDHVRTPNAQTVRQVQTSLNQVYAALGECLVRECPSVGALLHPRSTPGRATMGAFYSARTLQEVHEEVRNLPGGLAVYVSRDHTSATIGTRGIRPADGVSGLVIHLSVDIREHDPAQRAPRFIPAQPLHNSQHTAASVDELRAALLAALTDADLVPPDSGFDDERWRYF